MLEPSAASTAGLMTAETIYVQGDLRLIVVLLSPHHRGDSSTTGTVQCEVYGSLLSPHHRGDSSTRRIAAAALFEALCPLIIGEIRQRAGVFDHLRDRSSVPSSSGRFVNDRDFRGCSAGDLPSVPSSSGRFLNSTPQRSSSRAGFRGWFETSRQRTRSATRLNVKDDAVMIYNSFSERWLAPI